MNNRHETPYRLQRQGFDEIQVGWERVYELTPRGLMDKMTELSFKYDKAISVSFPEWWKSDKEKDLPALILNNIFGVIPYYDYNGNLLFVRVANLATNETIKDYPGTENNLLYICKHILTDCKKVLRSWGKEPFREFRYGIEYLRDKWHLNNHKDAFQRPDVRIYGIVRYNRLTPEEYFKKACKSILNRKTESSFNDDDDAFTDIVYERIVEKIQENLMRHFQDNKPADFDIDKDDLKRWFWFLMEKEPIVSVYKSLAAKTKDNYNIWTYINVIADAIVSAISRQQI